MEVFQEHKEWQRVEREEGAGRRATDDTANDEEGKGQPCIMDPRLSCHVYVTPFF